MPLEIERKFLVADASFRAQASAVIPIKQGYLSSAPHATVRVRIAGPRAFITVKGITSGATRSEWEYPIPLADAEEMLSLCQSAISKKRYIIPAPPYTWEVDEFDGPLAGLVVAEIELPSSDAVFAIPPFIGREVTDDPRYFNSALALSQTRPPIA